MDPARDLATKSDIARVSSEIAMVRSEVAQIAEALRDYQKTMLLALVGAMTVLTTIFSIIVGLIT